MGRRQKACGKPECQRLRRSETQARWRSRNPEYFAERRLRARWAKAISDETSGSGGEGRQEGVRPPAPFRVPKALRSIPWDLAQDELGVATTDLVAVVAARVLAETSRARPDMARSPLGSVA